MTEFNLPAIRTFLPTDGVAFHTESTQSLEDVSLDLCRIASFLQHHVPSTTLNRLHDWWEHDALLFPHGATDYHDLFQVVGTPRSLIESMTGDHRVFIALSPQSRTWYFRFFAEWDDDDDTKLIGEYSISLAQPLVAPFSDDVLPELKCSPAREPVLPSFQRIEA